MLKNETEETVKGERERETERKKENLRKNNLIHIKETERQIKRKREKGEERIKYKYVLLGGKLRESDVKTRLHNRGTFFLDDT